MASALDWHSIVIRETCSVEEAIKTINNGGYQLCLIIDDENKFVGIITDSDIRKALLTHKSLEGKASSIINTKPLIVTPDLSIVEAERIMALNNYLQIPIVNQNNELVGLHVQETFKHKQLHSENLVIMAGGKGERLLPLTKNLPKPMLPIQGKPILEHIIEKARLDGFINITISVNYLAEKITDYFSNGEKFGVNINYIFENAPLGTAGALAELPQITEHQYTVISNADLWTALSFHDLLEEAKKLRTHGLMAVRHHEIQNPFGVINTSGNKIISIEEKPISRFCVNAGMYIVTNSLLSLLSPNKRCDMPELFQRGLECDLKMHTYMMKDEWVDIGRIADYKSIID